MSAGDFFLLLASIYFANSFNRWVALVMGVFWSVAAGIMMFHKT